MINLIPQKAKRNLRFEYWVRAISVWFITWSVALFAGACIFFPAYVLIGTQINAYQESATAAYEKVAGYENASTELVQASVQAKSIMDEAALPQISKYITLFGQLEKAGIEIKKMSVTRNVEGISPITVAGNAADRQSLASFRDRILATEEVSSVDFPISNLAKDKDIQFSITVTLNNNNL